MVSLISQRSRMNFDQQMKSRFIQVSGELLREYILVLLINFSFPANLCIFPSLLEGILIRFYFLAAKQFYVFLLVICFETRKALFTYFRSSPPVLSYIARILRKWWWVCRGGARVRIEIFNEFSNTIHDLSKVMSSSEPIRVH